MLVEVVVMGEAGDEGEDLIDLFQSQVLVRWRMAPFIS